MNSMNSDTTSRRGWLARVAAALSTLAVARALPEADPPATTPAPTCPLGEGPPSAAGPGPEIREGASGRDQVLGATIPVEDEIRAFWTPRANPADPFSKIPHLLCSEGQSMRYFAGAPTGGKRVWPSVKGIPGPGPTLRAR